MTGWERTWHGPVPAVRPWLLARGMLALLAFDLWVLQLPHGGRYGAGGFNVAHFAWLDAAQPTPSPGLYVSVTLLAGGLALWGAIVGPTRALLAAVAALFTWAWAMSLQDAWQHHYLLSLLLVALTLGPDVSGPAPTGVTTDRAWAWRLVPATLASVYAWATVAKLDATWRGGRTLQRIAGGSDLRELEALLGGPDAAWAVLAWGATVIEAVLAVGYAAAVRRDDLGRSALGGAAFLLLWGVAMLLHGSIEWLGLRIGWFSYYLFVLASVVILPEGALRPVARVWSRGPDSAPVALGAIGLAGVVAVTLAADLPGAAVGGFLLAGALAAAWGARRGRPALAVVMVPVALALVLAHTSARFDFWRWYAGDLRRRGELDAALDAYRRAEAHAPPRESRAAAIEQLEQRLSPR